MSLTACPECSRQISTAAFACPGCGHPRPALEAIPRRRRIDWLVPAIAAGGLLASMVSGHLMWSAFQAQHAYSRGPHVEVVRTIEVHPPLPPPPIFEFAIGHPVEAAEVEVVEDPPRIFNP